MALWLEIVNGAIDRKVQRVLTIRKLSLGLLSCLSFTYERQPGSCTENKLLVDAPYKSKFMFTERNNQSNHRKGLYDEHVMLYLKFIYINLN